VEQAKVYVDFTYGVISNYVITAVFSSWRISYSAVGHDRQIIKITEKPIVTGRNYQEI
jgi:hypothetical protein